MHDKIIMSDQIINNAKSTYIETEEELKDISGYFYIVFLMKFLNFMDQLIINLVKHLMSKND